MRNNVFKYMIVMLVALTVCSCHNENEIENITDNVFLKFEIGDYPSYSADSRTIGIPDEGNTNWVEGDVILVKVTEDDNCETLMLTYENSKWNTSKDVVASDVALVEVIYAPGCEWDSNGALKLKSDTYPYGTFDYVEGDCELKNGVVKANFKDKRNYSRLRIVPNIYKGQIQVNITGFTPAGPVSATVPAEGYILETDHKGNAYLYGLFSVNSTIQVKKDDVILREYTFSSATTIGKSYAMEAMYQQTGPIPYVTFMSASEQTMFMSVAVETLEYSVNNGDWKELGTNTVAFGGEKGDIRLRGKSSMGTVVNGNNSKVRFSNNTDVIGIGDIRTLVDYENYAIASTESAKFCQLFSQCFQLVSAPELPATVLAENCYQAMFEECTNIVSAPELPATTLASGCYEGMFNDCTSLTKAPELPATTLAEYCYNGMFSSCSSLTEASGLPSTVLAENCYQGMFDGCINLVVSPELPATTLASHCYQAMFEGCTSLLEASELPATTLASGCYNGMFNGCTSLLEAPELPAMTLASGCYNGMFSGCSSLTKAPELPATTLTEYCYNGMFSGCSSLTEAPELPATTLALSCYYGMFSNCSSLREAPELPATTLAGSWFGWDGCYSCMFSGCTSLTEVPELPAATLTEFCYYCMFSGCTSLTKAPELPATTLAKYCYYSMFSGCSSLTEVPGLPATTLAECCYSGMFSNCSSLTETPILPAETLVNSCYGAMFAGCTSLQKVTMLATNIRAEECLTWWLGNVPSTGIFVKAKSMKSLPHGDSGIPEGWEVVDYEE